MFLKKLYSEPAGLFLSGKSDHPNTIVFKSGFNFIFGKKDFSGESKESLNGIGKSTVADLIDFCLLADFNKKNKRLYKEKDRMEDYYIVLEFKVKGIDYIIKRTVNNKSVKFGTLKNEQELDIEEAKNKLFEIIFKNPNYKGISRAGWYRSLISFFLKIHKKKKGSFIDPINFLTQHNRLTEINQYQFFLLGIDNNLICQNFDLQKDVKEKNKAISQVKKIVEQNYNIDIKEVDSKLSKLRNEIKKTKAAVDAFKLGDQFKEVEKKLNDLTANIKYLAEQNFWMEKKIKSYRESYEIKDSLSESRIKGIEQLYKEINDHIGKIVRKSLKESVNFRKKLAKSREEFLKDEIERLEFDIKKNDKEKDELDKKRQKLFLLLKSKEAFTDLTEAFYYLGEQEKEFSDLEGKIRIYRDLEIEKQKDKKKDAEIALEIKDFLENIKDESDNFENIFLKVYNNIYPKSDSSGFSINPKLDKPDKVAINVYFDKDESKGWNRGRTLIYDIAVMLNAIHNNINMPRFLLHDGIFDGMDKAQFVELYHYLKYLQKKRNIFQYIVTMNEEGDLNEKFGDTDELTVEKIADEAVAVFTPEHKFWAKRVRKSIPQESILKA